MLPFRSLTQLTHLKTRKNTLLTNFCETPRRKIFNIHRLPSLLAKNSLTRKNIENCMNEQNRSMVSWLCLQDILRGKNARCQSKFFNFGGAFSSDNSENGVQGRVVLGISSP